MTNSKKLDLTAQVLVTDGAMGTMLQKDGIDVSVNSGLANLTNPDIVQKINALYREAGSDIAISNSFIPCTSDDDAEIKQAHDIAKRGVEIARAANPNLVIGDIGPSAHMIEPYGSSTFEDGWEIYKRHISALLEGGPDVLMLETFIDVSDLRCCIMVARELGDIPIIVSATFNDTLRMPLSSTSPEAVAIIAESLGASMVGLNCGFGPEKSYKVLSRMAKATGLPLCIQPNAGLPVKADDGSMVYPGTPEEMAEYSKKFVELGATLVGSCCGSTPEFTKQITQAVRGLSPVWPREVTTETRLASAVDALVSVDGSLDCSNAALLDCSANDIDKWDIIDNSTAAPMVAICHDQSSQTLMNLDSILRYYPGRAVVCVDGSYTEVLEHAKLFGAAIAVEAGGSVEDKVASEARDLGFAKPDILVSENKCSSLRQM